MKKDIFLHIKLRRERERMKQGMMKKTFSSFAKLIAGLVCVRGNLKISQLDELKCDSYCAHNLSTKNILSSQSGSNLTDELRIS